MAQETRFANALTVRGPSDAVVLAAIGRYVSVVVDGTRADITCTPMFGFIHDDTVLPTQCKEQ